MPSPSVAAAARSRPCSIAGASAARVGGALLVGSVLAGAAAGAAPAGSSAAGPSSFPVPALVPASAAASRGACDGGLPASVGEALAHAQVPRDALALWVQPVDGGAPLVQWNADRPMNPASVFKLATTSAALDLLGPAWTWKTAVGLTGPIERGVLRGSLVIRGDGDPSLVIERLWLLLRRVRDLGVQTIAGDIVLDHGAFAPPERSPADFDGEPAEPYNVQPDALLLNFKSVTLRFVPDPAHRVARVIAEPPLAGVVADGSVRLGGGACGDWRSGLKLATSDPTRWRFAGSYPASCGERAWPVAYADPASYDTRLVAAMWRDLGGALKGAVRDGATPEATTPAFELASPPLADVIRDINKFSNNVMAEQVWLTLGLQKRPGAADPATALAPATPADARAVLAQWLHDRLGANASEVAIVNGSGLARETRMSARTLARLLQWAWSQPTMPELASSLPVVGVDGTLRRSSAAPGRAHLKTGSMRDVAALAGFVDAADGRRYVLVALVNDERAGAAHAALDASVRWVEEIGAADARTDEGPPASRPAGLPELPCQNR
jgi:D-alanyl-D-alanine carboxypeptidase/D-alanyl-D-alanine-endopeptidase (penicillin-binding protein 4)